LDKAGNLYGTTNAGGAYGYGTVFKLDSTGTETLLYSFMGGTDGASPWASVILDKAGNLYGTTCAGGAYGYGTVYEVDTTGAEELLYSFMNGSDGANPYAGLIWDPVGNLYGTTSAGGTSTNCNGCGTVFKLTPGSGGWTETVLHAFDGRDGAQPMGGLLRDAAGNFYGTTFGGTVFKLSKKLKVTVLYSVDGFSDGNPYLETLVRDRAGTLYGTATGSELACSSESDACGIVFKLHGHAVQILQNFGQPEDEQGPDAGVIRDNHGNLYGTTYYGGAYGWGSVFKLTGTKMTFLHSFACHGNEGIFPVGPVVQDAAGNFYGTTSAGGAYGYGIVFKLSR